MAQATTSNGTTFQYDEADAYIVNSFKWRSQVTAKGKTYIATTYGGSSHYLHRALTRAKKGEVVDHINGDTLDNRRANLRVCTAKENTYNKRTSGGASKYKGVHTKTNGNTWTACIKRDGVTYRAGTFKTEEEAAMAYNDLAKQIFGQFAWLNVIEQPQGV
jgi:hypothetical protein